MALVWATGLATKEAGCTTYSREQATLARESGNGLYSFYYDRSGRCLIPVECWDSKLLLLQILASSGAILVAVAKMTSPTMTGELLSLASSRRQSIIMILNIEQPLETFLHREIFCW